jgi:hypothetical protein
MKDKLNLHTRKDSRGSGDIHYWYGNKIINKKVVHSYWYSPEEDNLSLGSFTQLELNLNNNKNKPFE